MHRRLHKLLLILVILSVALAPLRAAWALPDSVTPDPESHCAGMQHDMQQMHHDTGHGSKADSNSPGCKSGCNGSCCDKSCMCLHATVAIPASVIVQRAVPGHVHCQPVACYFPDRPPDLPLHPPIAFHS